jgi:membrane protein
MDTLSTDKLQTAARKQASWAVGAFRQFAENRCAAMAAGIAFYAAFSLAPTLVMVIAVAGWFFGADAARGELFREVHGVLGDEAAAGVQTIVQNAHHSGSAGGIAAIISFVLLAVGASATFSSLNSALNIVWPFSGARTSSVLALVRVRLISFGLVLGVAFLLIVSLVLDAAITFVGRWLLGDSPYLMIGNLLQLAVGLFVLAAAFAALLKFLPDAPVQWRDALVGGFVSALLFSAGKKLFALYLAHAGMANSFGAAGSLAVLLMWLYFSALVLLLGAEFSAARGRLHDPRGPWGMQEQVLPGSRAMLASAIAASTVAVNRSQSAMANDGADPAPTRPDPASGGSPRPSPPVLTGFVDSLARAEMQATRAAAATFVQAAHTAAHTAADADRYVRRHPWGSMLIAAGAAFVVTAVAGRRDAGNPTPASRTVGGGRQSS